MNEIAQRSDKRPMLAGNQFRQQPTKWSPEGRAITRSDRQAIARAHDIANDAAVADFTNELVHQVKLNEIQRRGRRAMDVMHGASTLMSVAETLAHGNPAQHLEFIDIYNAWKQGEIYRMVTD